MLPESGDSSPAMQRSKVVLPQPEAPSRKNNSPGSISSDGPSKARTLPNVLTRELIRIPSMIISEIAGSLKTKAHRASRNASTWRKFFPKDWLASPRGGG
jgi:hypothetical protein